MAINVAYGCNNRCLYCYGRKIYGKDLKMKFPEKHPVELVSRQLEKGLKPEGVFISFMTDPMLDVKIEKFLGKTLQEITLELVNFLLKRKIKVALLTKMGYPPKFLQFCEYKDMLWLGTTVVSMHEEWCRKYEPNALYPVMRRNNLKTWHDIGFKTWLSFEPDLPPALLKHDPVRDVLHNFYFMDLVVYGKMNYLKGSGTAEARKYYMEQIPEVEKFCKEHKIKLHIKKKTEEFVKNVKKEG